MILNDFFKIFIYYTLNEKHTQARASIVNEIVNVNEKSIFLNLCIQQLKLKLSF